jgi:hypothetical protein
MARLTHKGDPEHVKETRMHAHEHRQFSDEQRERAVALIESIAWGDLDGSIIDMEAALRLAMDATRDDFQRWEQDAEHRLRLRVQPHA